MKLKYEADRLDWKINELLQHDAQTTNALAGLESVSTSLLARFPSKALLAPQGAMPS